jgi:hypothetical protein
MAGTMEFMWILIPKILGGSLEMMASVACAWGTR